ncbi:MAG: ADP-forming succinate--CoA ligase subunit beta [Chloroflexota bacterium]|nr:ADP-forming succinate--CoA ligase subunit beta [Chloroflexota bacterium]
MKIHEYQAKKLLADYGIAIPKGAVANTAAEAEQIATDIGGEVIVKAQVHTGGRGKAGGIKKASTPREAGEIAKQLIGTKLVTHQTGAQGLPIPCVLVEQTLKTSRELYLGVVLDTSQGMPVIMASEAGGMEIEEVAQSTPEKILKTWIHPTRGFWAYQARELAFGLNLTGNTFKAAVSMIPNIYRLFQDKDCSLVEINPLVVTTDDRLLALDAKLNVHDTATFRQKAIAEMRDTSQEDPLEVEAKSRGIENYVKLDGNIGCIVNGAGLAMGVMDILKLSGGQPANFLDIGTVNNPDRVVKAIEIIVSDPNVKAIMVNIFGGMARVDVIATGLVTAAKQLGSKMPPTIVRLAGTNVDAGEEVLAQSGLEFIRAKTFTEAADKAVAAAKGGLA